MPHHDVHIRQLLPGTPGEDGFSSNLLLRQDFHQGYWYFLHGAELSTRCFDFFAEPFLESIIAIKKDSSVYSRRRRTKK